MIQYFYQMTKTHFSTWSKMRMCMIVPSVHAHDDVPSAHANDDAPSAHARDDVPSAHARYNLQNAHTHSYQLRMSAMKSCSLGNGCWPHSAGLRTSQPPPPPSLKETVSRDFVFDPFIHIFWSIFAYGLDFRLDIRMCNLSREFHHIFALFFHNSNLLRPKVYGLNLFM